MIHWLWLIPAVLVGAVIGMVLTCLAVAAQRWMLNEKTDD